MVSKTVPVVCVWTSVDDCLYCVNVTVTVCFISFHQTKESTVMLWWLRLKKCDTQTFLNPRTDWSLKTMMLTPGLWIFLFNWPKWQSLHLSFYNNCFTHLWGWMGVWFLGFNCEDCVSLHLVISGKKGVFWRCKKTGLVGILFCV